MPDNLPGIVGDAHRLEQAFANLLDNAIKYSTPRSRLVIKGAYLPEGAPRPEPLSVSSGLRPSAAGGAQLGSRSWLYVSITNQGEPIPAPDLTRVFGRFYRAAKSRSGAEGSGLGLAIVRETVVAHGGYVEVSSDADRGTCFRTWLPARDEEGIEA